MNSIQYIAFLRGINVGGNAIVRMEALRQTFEELGCIHVKTLLASGNVIFVSSAKDITSLTQTIEEKLAKTFGWEINVILRTAHQMQTLINSDPFKDITITPSTRLYVTFVSEASTNTLKLPYESPEKDFKILSITDCEVCSVLILSQTRGTVDLMKILEKEFGKKVTTRSWNTVKKVSGLL